MGSNRFWLGLPVVVLVLIVALLLLWRPLDRLSQEAPPVEEAAIERVNLTPGMISLDVRTDGSEPVVIAQVQVDTAYRVFTATPAATGARLGLMRIDIPYSWIEGEAHHIALLTSTGAIIDHTIEVATATPVLSGASLGLTGGGGPVAWCGSGSDWASGLACHAFAIAAHDEFSAGAHGWPAGFPAD